MEHQSHCGDEAVELRRFFKQWPGGQGAAARRLDKRADTLSHEINGTPNYKFGYGDALEATWAALHEVRHPEPLALLVGFAARFGCVVTQVRLPDGASAGVGEALHRFAATAKEFADVAQVMMERVGDGDVSDNDLKAFDKEWGELMAAGNATRAALTAANQAARDKKGAASPNLKAVG